MRAKLNSNRSVLNVARIDKIIHHLLRLRLLYRTSRILLIVLLDIIVDSIDTRLGSTLRDHIRVGLTLCIIQQVIPAIELCLHRRLRRCK